jgi:uncharacterized protein YcbK (DUF882 family)
LQVLRDAVGSPIKVTSGYRCAVYQRMLKERGYETAAGPSTHEEGRAADIVVTGDKARFKWFLEMLFKAIGDGGDWVHVDLRREKVRRWGYRQNAAQADPGKTS